jgi:hypothetical protein
MSACLYFRPSLCLPLCLFLSENKSNPYLCYSVKMYSGSFAATCWHIPITVKRARLTHYSYLNEVWFIYRLRAIPSYQVNKVLSVFWVQWLRERAWGGSLCGHILYLVSYRKQEMGTQNKIQMKTKDSSPSVQTKLRNEHNSITFQRP